MSTRRFVVDAPERLDRIAKALYGSERDGTVEALLMANAGLAALIGPSTIVPAGTELVVPDTVAAAAPAITRPWN